MLYITHNEHITSERPTSSTRKGEVEEWSEDRTARKRAADDSIVVDFCLCSDYIVAQHPGARNHFATALQVKTYLTHRRYTEMATDIGVCSDPEGCPMVEPQVFSPSSSSV